MAKLIFDLSSKRILRQPPRPIRIVEHDLRTKHVVADPTSGYFLAWYPKEQYDAILGAIGRAKAVKKFTRLSIDPPEKNQGIDFNALSTGFLLEQVDGLTLVLKNLVVKSNQYRKRAHPPEPAKELTPWTTEVVTPKPALIIAPKPPLERRASYLDNGRLFQLSRRSLQGKKENLSIELVREPFDNIPDALREEVTDDLTNVFVASLRDQVIGPMDRERLRLFVRDHYFQRADRMAVVRNGGNEVAGFNAISRDVIDGEPIVAINGTYLAPKLRAMHLSIRLTYYFLWEFLSDAPQNKIKIIVRAAAPRVVGSTQILSNCFPDFRRPAAQPPAEIRQLLGKFAARFAPGSEYDAERSILRGDFRRTFGFSYDQNRLPPHRDPAANLLCERLNYDEGDAFLFYGELSRSSVIRSFAEDQRIVLNNWWRSEMNQAKATVLLR
jgi:hypothetical protein